VKIAAAEGDEVLIGNRPIVEPFIISITGATGQIAYSLIPRICSGEMFGKHQRMIIRLIDIPQQMNALQGIKMELEDCAFPLVESILITDDLDEGFDNSDYCILLGGKARGKGQERKDVLKENAAIFSKVGKVVNRRVDERCQLLVVANPANTNALILSANAPNINPRNITALTRLDHDRGLGFIAQKANCLIQDIDRFCIWGNHSSTQYPDSNNVTIRGKWLREVIKDDKWIFETFIPSVQKRGAAIIEARGKSSALSATTSIMKHFKDLLFGTNKWTSMAIRGDGQYGVPSTIWCSVPVVCQDGDYQVVGRVEFTNETSKGINKSIKELLDEKEAVASLLPPPQFGGISLDKKVFSWRYFINTVRPELISVHFKNDVLLNELKEIVCKDFDYNLTDVTPELISKLIKERIVFASLKGLFEKHDIKEDDLPLLTESVLKRSILYDIGLYRSKIEGFNLTLQEEQRLPISEYRKMSKTEKIQYHLRDAFYDGLLDESGIKGKILFSNKLNSHFK